jgi:iron complex outermembrane receptor protein
VYRIPLTQKASLFLGAATVATLGFVSPALAQATAANEVTEVVTVTGSRIATQGVEAASPVTVVGQQEIQFQGATTVGELMQELPSTVEDGDSSSVDNGGSGLSTIDLRNLGTKRTLVLVDGKRLVAADAKLDVDTNVIPAGMIDHVEVLTGGDSAVYGSDAVAGVVNVILKKNFEGMTFDTQEGITGQGDGVSTDSNLMMGFNSADGHGNITIYGEYMHRDAVTQGQRPYGAHALGSSNYAGCSNPLTYYKNTGLCYTGSSTITSPRIKSPALGGPYVGQTTESYANGTLAPYDHTAYNFAPFQYYQTQGQRYSFGANANYKINNDIDFYTRLTFANNSTRAQLGPSPMTQLMDINCGNPLMSSEQRQTLFGNTVAAGSIAAQCATVSPTLTTGDTNNVNGNAGVTDPTKYQRLISFALRLQADGPRISQFEHNTFQYVGGFRGDNPFLPGWTYDVSGQYGQTSSKEIDYNDALKGNFQNALLVNPTTGNCYVGGSCVPVNIFAGPGGVTPAAVNYFRENLLVDTLVQQMDLQASTTGDLSRWGGQSPWAKNPVSVAIGAEYRQERASLVPDYNTATGNLLGFEAQTLTQGQFDVAEGFAELLIPIIQDRPMAQDLSVKGAYRFSSYDKSGDTSTFSVNLNYQPIADFRFRADYDRSVRAPNVAELFTPAGGSSANSGRDPCSANGASIPTTAALCQATGVPGNLVFNAALNCPSNQCQGAVGGNPFLKPEIAVTQELGVVITPSFLDNFTVTADWYNIKINGFIEETPLATILNNCYSTTANSSQSASNIYCGFVHRDTLGTIATANTGFVVQAEGNVASDEVQGLDFELNYNWDLGNTFDWNDGGSLSFHYLSTWVTQNETAFEGAAAIHCAGLYGPQCGEPQLRYKGNFRTTWVDPTNTVSVSLLWRYLSGAQSELSTLDYPGFTDSPDLHLPAMNYFDLSATWAITDSLLLRAGIRNLLDRDPPLTDYATAPASDVSGNTFPNTYDVLGRQFFLGVNVKL